MSLPDGPPLSRRSARAAARAAGEQPMVEDPATSGPVPTVVTIDGAAAQAGMTRRRLREMRARGEVTGEVVLESATGEAPSVVAAPAEPVREPEAAVETVPPPQITAEVVPEPEPAPEPAAQPEPQRESIFAPPAAKEWVAPQGHWTRQLEVEDDDDALETTMSREVGAANPTTSALIVPVPPAPMDLGGPLDSAGEILLTGSIPLSPSLSTTGSIERLSDGDADRDDHFDDRRMHDSAQDAQPVRAAAIASQHALGTPIVSDGKVRGARGLTILLVTASALAVIVTGLVITAIALRWI